MARNARRSPDPVVSLPIVLDHTLTFAEASAYGLDADSLPANAVLVPTESVLLLAVDLPLSSHRQRGEAAPYAVEDLLAAPLSDMHIALGPELDPKRYLIGAVSRARMAGWIETLSKAGLAGARIFPDALCLPRPRSGSWSVHTMGERVLVRGDDGAAFAIALALLPAAWRLAGSPSLISSGDPLPAGLLGTEVSDATVKRLPDPVAGRFDLRQGAFAGSGGRRSRFVRRALIIAGVGALAWGGILAADTLALARLAGQRHDAAQAMLRRMMPGAAPEADVAGQLARLLPSEAPTRTGRFLPLFASVAEALNRQSNPLSVQNLTYNAADKELILDVTANDLAALQRVAAAMTDAGIQASSGAATADKAGADVRIVVSDRQSGAGS